MQRLTRLLRADERSLLRGGNKGLEKESLRVTPTGKIAQTPHPVALGSALTHPHITTDYSEALLEFITPPFSDVHQLLEFLHHIHQFVYRNLEDEMLWASSMPCPLKGANPIPIARYGSSNVGTMKHVYRRGLENRYGGLMQVIAGVHFNYSLPEDFWPFLQSFEKDSRTPQEFISDSYFALIRNFQRLGWLIPYLFGTSAAVCKSFLSNHANGLSEFDDGTYFGPNATSLRMSDIGYKNKVQASLDISYNNLDEYVADLVRVIETAHSDYEKIGVVVNGEYKQLNANILQIENEYYSFMRPKQVARSGEKPMLALKRRGVRYVELRALDVDIFDPLGVNEDQLRFLEVFLVLCLLLESPPITPAEQGEIYRNEVTITSHGRDPESKLLRDGKAQTVMQWAIETCEMMKGICEVLDEDESHQSYARALEAQTKSILDPEQTPSARMLAEMRANKTSFFGFAMDMSQRHKAYFSEQPMTDAQVRYFEDATQQSIARQQEIEVADELSFDDYLKRYFAQS
ncbi:MAG: glutamate--cysteine ligase [Acidiferrobacterales bacterium]|nr:glutamate--cysteine ligase [Pseudomonadota bacterium]